MTIILHAIFVSQILKVKYVVSVTLYWHLVDLIKLKHIFKYLANAPFACCASPNSNITNTSLMDAYEGMSQQVKVHLVTHSNTAKTILK